MSTFANSLKARTHWALHRVSVVAGDDKTAATELRRALDYARRGGKAGGWDDEDMSCPALLADVQPLRDAFMDAFEAARGQRRKLRTQEGIAAELDAMAAEANRGCGQSYELFTSRFSDSVDGLLDELESPFRTVALELAKGSGYATPEEREEMQQEIAASGGCSLTGIDPWCCPCGRHE